MGDFGERLVINYLLDHDESARFSEDWYDSIADIYINGNITVEVKTQVPFYSRSLVTIKDNQLGKCLGVDRLIFVVVPSPGYDTKNARIVEPQDRGDFVKYGNSGRKMVGWHLSKCKVLKVFDDVTTEQIQKFYSKETK